MMQQKQEKDRVDRVKKRKVLAKGGLREGCFLG
jgi:hypothetical protein